MCLNYGDPLIIIYLLRKYVLTLVLKSNTVEYILKTYESTFKRPGSAESAIQHMLQAFFVLSLYLYIIHIASFYSSKAFSTLVPWDMPVSYRFGSYV